jgi:hypothetical protein
MQCHEKYKLIRNIWDCVGFRQSEKKFSIQLNRVEGDELDDVIVRSKEPQPLAQEEELRESRWIGIRIRLGFDFGVTMSSSWLLHHDHRLRLLIVV